MKNQVLKTINQDRIKNNLLFFVKLSYNSQYSTPYEEAFNWRNLTFWMHIKKSYLTDGHINGCTALTWDEGELQKMAKVKDGSPGFLYENGGNKEARCFHDGIGYPMDGEFINLADFYAFAVDEGYAKNITAEVVNRILFTPSQ